MISRLGVRCGVALLLALILVPSAPAQLGPLPQDQGANGLGLALRRLNATARVLYVTAHPDDENNGVLVRLSRGLGLRTGLLTLTRGEGGQNAIGPELFDALGVLRTEELLALHRYDGVEQYFSRAYEFGFSFSVEETFEKWGREATLGDVVRVVRAFRPDVILTQPLEAAGGGMHHQAAARLARDAFRAAADPARFPEQLKAGLQPWQARKIYQGGTGGFPEKIGGPAVHVPTGAYDPLLGMSWQEFGSLARASHRCQGASQLKVNPGRAEGLYYLIDSEPAVTGVESDILDGVDVTLRGLLRFPTRAGEKADPLAPGLQALEASVAAAQSAFDPRAPEKAVPPLAAALRAVRALRESPGPFSEGTRLELEDRLGQEEKSLQAALGLAAGLVLDVRVDDGEVVPGQTFGAVASLFNQGSLGVAVEGLELQAPPGWTVRRTGGEPHPLAPGEGLRLSFAVTVGEKARLSQPYWHRRPQADRLDLDIPADEGLPFSPPDLKATLRYALAGVSAPLEAAALWHYEGPFVGGEKEHVLMVVPALSVRLTPDIAVLPLGASPRREFRVTVRNNDKGAAAVTARLQAPPGFSLEPPEVPLAFGHEGEEIAARFFLTPPPGVREGEVTLKAVAVRGGREFREDVQDVAYEHIQERHLVRPATTRVLALDVRTLPGAKVGYVLGPGDAGPEALRQLGLPVTLLGTDDLAYGDLSTYTTIVTGIRAYEVREDLRSYHHRLLSYVEGGGHLVVQYNRAPFNSLSPPSPPSAAPLPAVDSPFAPYPASVTPNRITDETAPMKVLVPDHPLLTTPNRIGARDWEGWVQERGIQFLEARDPHYLELLAATDPFPKNPGEKKGILVDAKVGKGTWTYVGLGLFRQLPAGTPGAYRILANLVSRPRASGP